MILSEVARRVRDPNSLAPHAAYNKPLVVVLTKCDAWSHLLGGPAAPEPWVRPGRVGPFALAVNRVLERSRALQGTDAPLLSRYNRRGGGVRTRGGVRRRERPGGPRRPRPAAGGRSIKGGEHPPRDVHPYWAAVPLLYVLSRAVPGLIARLPQPARVAAAPGRRGHVSHELLYTSVPPGVIPGVKGYCTVARTAGLPDPLVTLLESHLSDYRHGPDVPPVVWSASADHGGLRGILGPVAEGCGGRP